MHFLYMLRVLVITRRRKSVEYEIRADVLIKFTANNPVLSGRVLYQTSTDNIFTLNDPNPFGTLFLSEGIAGSRKHTYISTINVSIYVDDFKNSTYRLLMESIRPPCSWGQPPYHQY